MELTGKIIYSVGTGGRPWEVFAHLLQEHGIGVVADVRIRPTSSIPHFQQSNLSAALKEAGIQYVYLGKELGGYRRGGYKAHMTTVLFAGGMDRLESLARSARTVFMCAETLPWRCHRWHISRELESRGWQVLHLISPGRVWKRDPEHNEGRLWTIEP
jgi:uncharacterized protein (DUF488 family)